MSCKECLPILNPTGQRESDNHIAVRFGDDVVNYRVYIQRPLIGDEDVTQDCYEAIAGEGGVVWRYMRKEGDFYSCACGQGAEAYATFASVRIEAML